MTKVPRRTTQQFPGGYLVGRKLGSRTGPMEPLKLRDVTRLGIASGQTVNSAAQSLSTTISTVSTADSTSLSQVSSSLSTTISTGTSVSSQVSSIIAAGGGGAGAPGAMGPPGWDGDPGDDGWPIPGPAGAAGVAGAAGAVGPQGPIGFAIDGLDGDEGMPIPGPIGPAGATGANGSAYVVPTLASFTWVNQGTSTATQTVSGQAILLNIADAASLNWRIMTVAQPSTPYKVIAQYKAGIVTFANVQITGIYFYDGTKLMGFEVVTEAGTVFVNRVEKITNVTTDGSTPKSTGASLFPIYNPIWMQLRNDGSTIFFDYSEDGQNFINYYSEAVGTFITPTKIGFGGLSDTSGSSALVMSLLNWSTVGNANLDG